MFLRLLYQSFLRQRRRKLLAGLAVMLGMVVATATISVGVNIGDKMNKEIRAYGANILVYPLQDTLDVQVGGVDLKPASDGAYLDESELVRIKHIFWAHNILAYSPMLPIMVSLPGSPARVPLIGTYFAKAIPLGYETFVTGVEKTHPWWHVDGSWPKDTSDNEVLLGGNLSARLRLKTGDAISIAGQPEMRVVGILKTGGAEEDAIVAPLHVAQKILGRPGAVRRVYVSALTKPEDDFARRDPRSMSPAMLERWSCSPYANSIAYQIKAALPDANAEQVRKVAQNEGVLLSRISGLMLLITFAAVLAAVLAISAAMATTIFERRREIGLMRSLGANNASVSSLFLCEALLLGLAGGSLGFIFGELLAQRIARTVFNTGLTVQPVLYPLILMLAVIVTVCGSITSIRRALRFDPALVLRGDAA